MMNPIRARAGIPDRMEVSMKGLMATLAATFLMGGLASAQDVAGLIEKLRS